MTSSRGPRRGESGDGLGRSTALGYADVERVREKCQTLRQRLQSAADKARNARRRKRIRKKLHRRALKEASFRRNTNHVLAKRIVEQAFWHYIALEDLKGIRASIRFRKPQRPAWRDGLLTN